jgi:hypothetical protein
MEYPELKAMKELFLDVWERNEFIYKPLNWCIAWGHLHTILPGAFIHPINPLRVKSGQITTMRGLMGVKCLVIGTNLGSVVIHPDQPGSWEFKLAAHPNLFRDGYLKKEAPLDLSTMQYILGAHDALYSLSQEVMQYGKIYPHFHTH